MIDVIVSKEFCPHCNSQVKTMQKSFFVNEYRIIEAGTSEFETLDIKEKIDAVPFIVVRDDETGEIKYADKGERNGTQLRQIERVGTFESAKTFNLREIRMAQVAHVESRID